MAIKKQPPIVEEIAPPHSAFTVTDQYLQVLSNPDPLLASKSSGNLTVYKETLRDDTVKSTFQQRRLSVIAAEWRVDAGAEDSQSQAAAEELHAQLSALNWDDINEKMLFGIYYGYSVAEVLWGQDGSRVTIDAIKVRDRDRFRFDIESNLYLRTPEGIYSPMPDRKFWTFSTGSDNSDNPYGLGLAHWLYWPVYFKRADIKFWLIFLEKWGMPTAVGKMPAGKAENEAERKKMLEALRSIAIDSAVVIPDGAEFSLLEAVRGGAASYEEFKSAQDQAIAKIVLSQVMTSEAVGGQYKAEVQGGILDKVVKSDADLLCGSFNRTVVKWWTEYNFPNAVPPRVWRNTEPPEDLTARAERDNKIFALGFEPTEEYIRETYGEGWVKKQQPAVLQPFGQQPGQQDQDNPAANFSDLGPLWQRKQRLHDAQDAIEAAAQQGGSRWREMIGPRVNQLLGMLEETGDLVTFRERLTDLFGDKPSQNNVDIFAQAMFAAELVGRGAQQRDEVVKFAEAMSEQAAGMRDIAAALTSQPAPTIHLNPEIKVQMPSTEPKPMHIEYDEQGLIKSINQQALDIAYDEQGNIKSIN